MIYNGENMKKKRCELNCVNMVPYKATKIITFNIKKKTGKIGIWQTLAV
jgi:hypothetical protein